MSMRERQIQLERGSIRLGELLDTSQDSARCKKSNPKFDKMIQSVNKTLLLKTYSRSIQFADEVRFSHRVKTVREQLKSLKEHKKKMKKSGEQVKGHNYKYYKRMLVLRQGKMYFEKPASPNRAALNSIKNRLNGYYDKLYHDTSK